MKKAALSLFLSAFFLPIPSYALNYEDYPTVRLRSLDKITARTMTFEAQVGSTVRFGEIFIKVNACRKPPPVQKNEAAGFLQIWQTDNAANEADKKSRWIFSGWMFSSSPGLSAMDHPVYDVWVIDCIGKDPEPVPPPEEQTPAPEEPATTTDDPGVVDDTQAIDQVIPAQQTDSSPAENNNEVTPADDPGAFDDSEPVPQDQPVQSDDEASQNATSNEDNTEFDNVIDSTAAPGVSPLEMEPKSEEPAFQGIY